MYRLSRLRYIFPLGLFISLFLDGSLSNVWAPFFFSYPYSMMSELVLLWLVFAYYFEGNIEIPLVPFAFFAGAVVDVYFTGILGLDLFLFPLIVELTKILSRYFSPSFLTIILIYFIDIVVFVSLTYIAYLLVGITQMDLSDFLIYTLTPTLALNLVYFVVLYWPIRRLFVWALSKKKS